MHVTQIHQGTLHAVSAACGSVRAVKADVAHVDFPAALYAGAYEYTPTDTEQIVEISGTVAERNITIHPIPSNYGRIAWDGHTLTVT